MQICLVRHAIAVERGAAGYDDDGTRPLTPRGRARMEEAAKGLRALFVPEIVVTSPLLRAKETAGILVKGYGLQKSRTCDALATGDNAALLAELDDIDVDRVILVGHEPYMSSTLSWLLTADDGLVSTLFRKGAAAMVSSSGPPRPGACTLEWLLQPVALRAVGGQRSE
jgi:phosphohistidine phosphatase